MSGQMEDERSFPNVLAELNAIKRIHVDRQLNWFRSHALLPRVCFRSVGVLIIILSVSIPLLAVLDGFWRDVLLPIVALAIAGLTGLNSFFQWQRDWQGYRQTQFALVHLIAKWELDLVQAKRNPIEDDRINMAIIATQELLNGARAVTSAETQDFFQNVRMPQSRE